jgi:methylthioribose-1-phosphate isomerase
VPVEAVGYDGGAVLILDQTRLPAEEHVLHIRELEPLCEAIRSLRVRGAPAIGVAAAYGFRMEAEAWARAGGKDIDDLRQRLRRAAAALGATRPTARNLFVAIERLSAVVDAEHPNAAALVARVAAAANAMHDEDRALCAAIARHGAALLPASARVITHCNAGALATGGMGTALGVVYEAVRQGKSIHVFADETRPLLQGARLTTWELQRAHVPVTLLCDNAAASLLAAGGIHCAIVGADRIARNGDTANKVGTLSLALAAERYGVPFYVAAPSTTIDLGVATGADIPIEQRGASEVAHGFGVATAPAGVAVYNPAFDVTPGELVAAIVHEHGVVRPPYERTLAASLGGR